jgi:hypothetical protein
MAAGDKSQSKINLNSDKGDIASSDGHPESGSNDKAYKGLTQTGYSSTMSIIPRFRTSCKGLSIASVWI